MFPMQCVQSATVNCLILTYLVMSEVSLKTLLSAQKKRPICCSNTPNMPRYPQPDGSVKLAAGWLIDQCRLKGHQIGGAAVHDRQALVLVNKNNASAQDVHQLAQYVCNTVFTQFQVELHAEPNWLPTSYSL